MLQFFLLRLKEHLAKKDVVGVKMKEETTLRVDQLENTGSFHVNIFEVSRLFINSSVPKKKSG